MFRGNTGNKSSDVAMDMIGLSISNNTYGFPVNTNQTDSEGTTEPNEAPTLPLYSQVNRAKPTSYDNDVYANPDDVTVTAVNLVMGSSSNGQVTEWVDNTLYGTTAIFPVESEATRNDSNEQAIPEPPLTMKGQPGWVENIIYE